MIVIHAMCERDINPCFHCCQNLLFVTDQMENRVLVFRDGTGVLAKSYEIGAESLRDITVYAPENQPSLQGKLKSSAQ